MGIITLIINALTGNVANKLADAYASRNNAVTEQERIKADVDIARLEAQQKNRELGGRLTAWVQALWAAPFIIYNAKLILWDKVLGWGTTDPLSEELYTIQAIVVTFYFGGAVAKGLIRVLRR
jgi:hypothetical protein